MVGKRKKDTRLFGMVGMIVLLAFLLIGCGTPGKISLLDLEESGLVWEPSPDTKMKKLVFSVPDLDKKMCETFPRVILSSLESMPGVIDASFEFNGHVVTVYFDPNIVKREELLNNEAYAWVGTRFISEEKSKDDATTLFSRREQNNDLVMPGDHMAKIPIDDKRYNDLSAQKFKELVDDPDVFVLDVHIPEQNHIEGTDSFIPFNTLSANLDELPKDKNTVIALYCRSGSMSKSASEELVAMGYMNVNNLIGGINEWKQEGLPVEE